MRADFAMSRTRPGRPTVAETVREHVHVTTCGYTTVPPLQCELSVMGVDRVLFSVDYPYADSNEATAFLAQAPISPADREKIRARQCRTSLQAVAGGRYPNPIAGVWRRSGGPPVLCVMWSSCALVVRFRVAHRSVCGLQSDKAPASNSSLCCR